VVLVVLGAVLAIASPASVASPCSDLREEPAMQQAMARGLAARLGITVVEALHRLDIQDRAAGLSTPLEAALGASWGAMWFDLADGGRLKVGVAGGGDTSAARAIVSQCGLSADTDFVPVRWAWHELLDGHARFTITAASLYHAGQLTSGIDTSRNAIVADTASDMTPVEHELLDRAIAAAGVAVIVTPSTRDDLAEVQLSDRFPARRPRCAERPRLQRLRRTLDRALARDRGLRHSVRLGSSRSHGGSRCAVIVVRVYASRDRGGHARRWARAVQRRHGSPVVVLSVRS